MADHDLSALYPQLRHPKKGSRKQNTVCPHKVDSRLLDSVHVEVNVLAFRNPADLQAQYE